MMDPKLPEHTNEPGVAMAWRNSGQTPAKNVVSWGQIAVIETANEERLLTIPTLEDKFATSLGMNGFASKFIWLGRQLTADEIRDVGTGARCIYLYGRIEYRDVFKIRRWTNFRYRWSGKFPTEPKNVVFATCEQGNTSY